MSNDVVIRLDPARYVDVASQMPERRRGLFFHIKKSIEKMTFFFFEFHLGRRSLDRAISSSSTHRSNRHRRHSQHQQQVPPQQSPAQQSSVSYVANKVSFSLVNESTAVPITNNKQGDDEYELPVNEDHRQHIIPGESLDDDDVVDEEQVETEEENPILITQLREHANVIVSNILASVMDQINLNSIDE